MTCYTPVVMASLRTAVGEQHYQNKIKEGILASGCALCKEGPTLQEFTHWRIITNNFPYDLVAKVHHMILPIEHMSDAQITDEAWKELMDIKHSYIDERYEFIIESTHKTKSVPAHFHLHLLVLKDTI